MYTVVPPHLLSRLLYANPVCVLITYNQAHSVASVSSNTNNVSIINSSTTSSTEINSTDIILISTSSITQPNNNHETSIIQNNFNAMVISWLTPVDNRGYFTMSVNNNRYTLQNLLTSFTSITSTSSSSKLFTLSPAIDGMQDMLLKIGSISGKDSLCQASNGKLQYLQIPLCEPGSLDLLSSTSTTIPSSDTYHNHHLHDLSEINSPIILPSPVNKKQRKEPLYNSNFTRCIPQSPAHLVCEIEQILFPIPSKVSVPQGKDNNNTKQDIGHTIFLCRIIKGFVNPDYWITQKTFGSSVTIPISLRTEHEVLTKTQENIEYIYKGNKPPLLSFMGSKQFALIIPQPLNLIDDE